MHHNSCMGIKFIERIHLMLYLYHYLLFLKPLCAFIDVGAAASNIPRIIT